MLKRVLFVIAVLVGGVIGGYGSWVFHYILDANAAFITRNKWLAAIVGSLNRHGGTQFVHEIKSAVPVAFGLNVLGEKAVVLAIDAWLKSRTIRTLR